MSPPRRPGLLDRVLGTFTEVRPGESLTALLLMLNMFLLLAAYYLLKTIREPLILNARGGAEVKSYAAAATAGRCSSSRAFSRFSG
jgi:AAA family ATP:ADP antiporter